MGMVVVTGRRCLGRPVGVGRRRVVDVVVAVLVVSEVSGMAWRVLQRVADAHDRSRGGVQGKQEGEEKGEASAHGDELYQRS